MTQKAVFAVPGDIDTPTGGYVYDRRIIAELRKRGWQVEVLELGAGFPHPDSGVRHEALSRLAQAPRDYPVIVDGLALGVLPEAAEDLRDSHRIVALVHHPLALESDLNGAQRRTLHESERRALAPVRHVIVTSETTKVGLVDQFGVAANRVSVVRPGTDRITVTGRTQQGPVALLAVGAVVPRKGYDVLIAALAQLKALDWHLTIVGDLSRDAAAATGLKRQITANGLDGRITLAGAVAAEQVAAFYRAADVFVLASRFEGYGMAYADAVAHGLPVIGTNAGAIPEAVPADAGILVPPDDAPALTSVLRGLISDPVARVKLADGARAASQKLPTWEESGLLFAQAIGKAA